MQFPDDDDEMPFPDEDEDEEVPSIPMSKRSKRRPTIEEEDPSPVKQKKSKRRQKVESEEEEEEEVPSIPIKKRQQIVVESPPRRATRSRGIAVLDGYTSDISQIKLKKAKQSVPKSKSKKEPKIEEIYESSQQITSDEGENDDQIYRSSDK